LWLVKLGPDYEIESCDCGHTHKHPIDSDSEIQPVWAETKSEAKRIVKSEQKDGRIGAGRSILCVALAIDPLSEDLAGAMAWGSDGVMVFIPGEEDWIYDPTCAELMHATHTYKFLPRKR